MLYNATRPELSVYGQYARGFRAPLYSEINSGFTNITGRFFKYQTIPNPDLQPETSNSFEVGIRGRYPQFDFGLTGFYNTYNNFIETFQPAGIRCLVDADPCPTFSPALGGTAQVNVFQTQNISDARIFGVELGTEYRFSPNPDGFSLLGSLAWVQGDDLTRDEPLRSVDPPQSCSRSALPLPPTTSGGPNSWAASSAPPASPKTPPPSFPLPTPCWTCSVSTTSPPT